MTFDLDNEVQICETGGFVSFGPRSQEAGKSHTTLYYLWEVQEAVGEGGRAGRERGLRAEGFSPLILSGLRGRHAGKRESSQR